MIKDLKATVKNIEANFDFGGLMAAIELSDGRVFLVGDQAYEKEGIFERIDHGNPNDAWDIGSYWQFLGTDELLPIDDQSISLSVIDNDEDKAGEIYDIMLCAMWAEYEKLQASSMKKFNVEVNWHGAYDSDGWQVVNDEPIEAQSAQDVDDMIDPGWLEGCLSVIDEDGEIVPVESAEYRIVKIV